ncbi:pyridoxal phosphate-dependent aminotransferase [Zhongshania aquimaris]|uniref:Pyridoxal phosphate-dependent aminotransferase n=1 Tax=Zhongshania aquimaris TaxID=2857107 RepID=A0ABS6VMF0_9GAMM|nr:pyridoxal phosphate-dependent aminotransferase [Zhongshania aquimaris]MBW2939233.1 pyridoxal phosphate-dependent aminotransferase [Zhongshania aquimaris]
MGQHLKSKKLNNVCYEIRGPVLQRANELEEEGHRILKLNIGNPAPFGFNAPDEIIQDVIRMLPDSEGYSDSKGLYSARKAIMQECQKIGIPGVGVNDIYLGNGASELISMATQALLNQGDEVLIPAPDYPLWTAVVSLSGATPVHYICEEDNGWQPSIDDIVSKITPNTKAIVIINPNNPTGAVYSREMLEQLVAIAEAHELVVFADEIYSKILFDDAVHIPIGSLKADILCLTFNGLSKAYRLAGFRSGWLIVSGAKDRAADYIEGLNILSSMRLCANVPAQHAIQTALGGYQSINELILPGGRLLEQRDLAHKMLNEIPGVSCTKPAGAIYMFPRLDPEVYPVRDDEQLVLDLLNQEKILLVQGSGFNWHEPDHLRIVFLPNKIDLADAIERFANFLGSYRKQLLLSKQA